MTQVSSELAQQFDKSTSAIQLLYKHRQITTKYSTMKQISMDTEHLSIKFLLFNHVICSAAVCIW